MTHEEKKIRQRAYSKKWRDANLEKARKKCRDYHAREDVKNRFRNDPKRNARRRAYKKAWDTQNPDKLREYQQRYAEKNPGKQEAWKRRYLTIPENRIRYLLNAAKGRAKQFGREFDPRLLDHFLGKNLSTTCACCHTPFDFTYPPRTRSERHQAHTPSLDRIDNTKGYTLDNTAIICLRCNYLKNDATHAELKALVAYLDRALLKNDH